MKSLLVYLKNYVKESVFAPLFKLLEASFELIVPLVIAAIIDKGIANNNTSYILGRCGILVLLAIVGMVAAITAQYFAAKAATGFPVSPCRPRRWKRRFGRRPGTAR